MGYIITIGKFQINQDKYNEELNTLLEEENHSIEYCKALAELLSVEVPEEKDLEAPAFDEVSDFQNYRLPSYSAWAIFSNLAGLDKLFFEDNGAFKNHPGVFKITSEWLDKLNKTIKSFKQKYPNNVASYEEDAQNADKKLYCDYNTERYMPINHILCRCEWIYYWCNYAFAKYGDKAVITNC